MKDVLVDSYFYTHVSHLLGFDTDDVVSFNIKYFFELLSIKIKESKSD